MIENGVTSIGTSAFEHCSSLTDISIPKSVTSIGNYAFFECTGLTSINISEGVTSIGDDAFYGTLWLTNKRQENDSLVIVNGILIDGTTCSGEVTIPNDVTSIGEWAVLQLYWLNQHHYSQRMLQASEAMCLTAVPI
mgnify:CR=1 FL=1